MTAPLHQAPDAEHQRTDAGGCTCGWKPAPSPVTGWGTFEAHIGAVRADQCKCPEAEVDDGRCVLCGRPFPIGGAV